MKIKKIVVLLIILLSICFVISPAYATENKKTSIYMWEVTGIDYETYDKMADYLNINKIYAYIGTANIKNKIDQDVIKLFNFAKSKNIDIYAVYDENYANQTENASRIKEFIEEINEYNKTSTYKIKGLAIDSEFHTLEGYSSLTKEEQIELFTNYVRAMKEAYNLAQSYDIEYVVCVPVWLDKLDKTNLEELIKNGSSYVQLMNYNINNMVNNIKDEVEYAKKYNKKIENIAEFQIPGPHEVTEDDTFYDEGLEAGINKFEEIDNTYNYDLLTFSFHYYKPVVELYQKLDIKEEEEEKQQEQPKEDKENKKAETKKDENKSKNDKNEQQENKEDKNVKQEENNKEKENNKKQENDDNTIAKGNIPQTGENKIIIIGLIFVVITIGGIILIKLRKLNKGEK